MKNILTKLIIFIFFILIFLKKDIMYYTIYNTTLIWFKNIVPNLFPMFIITSLITDSNLLYYLCKYFGKFFSKIFNTSYYGFYVFFISLFAGSPSNAKSIKDLLNSKLISNIEANKLILFTLNYNPILIYNLLNLFLDKNRAMSIIFIIILTNIIIGLLVRNKFIDNNSFNKINKRIDIPNIIKNTIDTLLMILGTLIFFNIIINIIPIKNIYLKNIFNGLLEITTAIKKLQYLNINMYLKEVLSIIYLSFGGLSIHLQIKSILEDTNYKLFLKYRFLSVFISLTLYLWIG